MHHTRRSYFPSENPEIARNFRRAIRESPLRQVLSTLNFPLSTFHLLSPLNGAQLLLRSVEL